MLAVLFIATVVTLFLVWPVVTTHRRQKERFAAALDEVTDDPPSRARTSVPAPTVVRAGTPDRAEAQRRLEEAGLGLIALSGRLDVALDAGDQRPDSLSGELIAVDTALADIDATLRRAAALAAGDEASPRFDGLSHEVPTSLSVGVARLPDTPYALQDLLHERQTDAILSQLRVARDRAAELARFRAQLAKRLNREA